MSTKETLDLVLCDITAESALVIRGAITPFLEHVEAWEAKVALVDDAKVARASRLVLKSLRCDAEKVRKGLKDESLRFGRSVDAAFNKFSGRLEPMEATLLGIEQASERAELARINAINIERIKELYIYGVMLTGLGEMSAETYAQLLFNSRVGHEAKLEAMRKAESDRIAAENARLVEEARLREENNKLKAAAMIAAEAVRIEKERVETLAAEERQKVAAAAKQAAENAKAERDIIEANAKAEVDRLSVIANEQRKEADQARAKLKAAEDAEAKRVTVEVELRRKAAAAPDKAKLAAFADAIRAVGIPFLNAENSATAEIISEQRTKLCDWIELKASQL